MKKSTAQCAYYIRLNMGLDTRKPVFRVSDKVRLKPVSSATETSDKIENLLVPILDMILSNKRITKRLIRLCGCAGWSASMFFTNTEDRFSRVEAHIMSEKQLRSTTQTKHLGIIHIGGPEVRYGKYSKISNTFLFLFSDKMLVFRARIHKMLVRIA